MSTNDLRAFFLKSETAQFCAQHGIQSLSLFGSILRDDFGPASDVDVLVEFERDARVGLIKKAAIQNELSRLIGREVDLRTPAELSPYIRDRVLESASVQYVR